MLTVIIITERTYTISWSKKSHYFILYYTEMIHFHIFSPRRWGGPIPASKCVQGSFPYGYAGHDTFSP